MKKLFLSLLSLLVTVSINADVEINSSNFPDENFRSWLLSQDYGADGILTEEEIAGVTKIDANMKSIQSLKGIEFFTALTTLECYNNQLTSLDVSKNAALTYIRFGGNKLTSLDVSKNTALRTLLCDDNPLTALDLSNNTLLTRLDCGSPNLKTLNISGCKALYELNLSGTQLTSLDLSGKTNLKVLRCGSNQLKTLNVSGCTSLRDFSCDGNQLTTLNVSGCTGVKELYCSNNQLTSIDATGCTKLRELHIQCNKIQGQAMDDFIASLPTTSGRTMFVINNENEGNVMTTAQAAAAKAKGWTPYYYENGWQEYTGSEPAEPEVKKCATPIIGFFGGKLIFRCETEDVRYVCKVSDIEFETDGTGVSLPSKITISVYAKKDGYENSDTISHEIDPRVLMGIIGDVNGDGIVNGTDIQEVINIIVNGE